MFVCVCVRARAYVCVCVCVCVGCWVGEQVLVVGSKHDCNLDMEDCKED